MEQTSPVQAGTPGIVNAAALWKLAAGLPARLLLLTIAFVIVAEIAIFAPTVADFRRNWLLQRAEAGEIALLAAQARGGVVLPEALQRQLLTTAGVRSVSMERPDSERLALGDPGDARAGPVYDLRSAGLLTLIIDGMEAFGAPSGRLVHIRADAGDGPSGGVIEAVVDETPLRNALWRYAGNIFWLTLLVLAFTAGLVYMALTGLLVRPMKRITRNMMFYRENPEDTARMFYRENPEDTARIIAPSGRCDEIGVTENELAALQTQLTSLLREKARLANVGLAVSKINHDLRNMLAGAQLVSDRLASVADPTVERFVPRLIRALDRAITLCSNTVAYGHSEEAPPNRAPFALRPLIAEVNESLSDEDLDGVKLAVSVPSGLELLADRDQIYRVLFNLMRNSLESFREADPAPENPTVGITALREGDTAILRVSDNGPGVPPLIRKNLFKAFQAGASANGDGLGLAISAEIVRAHGGEIALDETVAGATFVVRLPAAVHSAGRIAVSEDVRDGTLAQNGISR
jgi:signal transduction histidine kinase